MCVNFVISVCTLYRSGEAAFERLGPGGVACRESTQFLHLARCLPVALMHVYQNLLFD